MMNSMVCSEELRGSSSILPTEHPAPSRDVLIPALDENLRAAVSLHADKADTPGERR